MAESFAHEYNDRGTCARCTGHSSSSYSKCPRKLELALDAERAKVKALKSILWMAKDYVDASGTCSQEQRDYDAVMAVLGDSS